MSNDWSLSEPISSGLVPFGWDVKCGNCEQWMDICAKRPLGQKFSVDGRTLCIACQESLGIEPVYDPRYASKDPESNPAYYPKKPGYLTERPVPLRNRIREIP